MGGSDAGAGGSGIVRSSSTRTRQRTRSRSEADLGGGGGGGRRRSSSQVGGQNGRVVRGLDSSDSVVMRGGGGGGGGGDGERPSIHRQGGVIRRDASAHTLGNTSSHISMGGDASRASQYRQVSGQRDNAQIKAELDARIRCPARKLAGAVIDNVYVKVAILFLIVANSVTMGIATFDIVTEDFEMNQAFEMVDFAFLLVFTAELCFQWLYRGWTLWKDGWLVFDFVIVSLSWAFESLQVVRAFRIFRALRLIGQLGPLRQLVLAIGTTLPRLQSIGLLLMLDIYIFSVLFTELWGDVEAFSLYFSSLPVAAFTCVEMMTLEDWGDVARGLTDEGYWYATIIIALFMVMTGFIVFNLIVAVVCDAVYMIHEHIRWLDGKDDESESEFMDALLAEEQIPERMANLVVKFRLMVQYQVHLERLVAKLIEEMRQMDLLEEDVNLAKIKYLENQLNHNSQELQELAVPRMMSFEDEHASASS